MEASDEEDALIICESLMSLAECVLKEVEVSCSTSIESEVEEMLSMSDWKSLEKDLYAEAVDIFGKTRFANLSYLSSC